MRWRNASAALLLAALVVGFSQSGAAAAGPESEVSQSALAAMGLGGMQSMSDEEGRQVRGKFARAFSFSSASGAIVFGPSVGVSTTNPAFAYSWRVGISPGTVTGSAGFAWARGG